MLTNFDKKSGRVQKIFELSGEEEHKNVRTFRRTLIKQGNSYMITIPYRVSREKYLQPGVQIDAKIKPPVQTMYKAFAGEDNEYTDDFRAYIFKQGNSLGIVIPAWLIYKHSMRNLAGWKIDIKIKDIWEPWEY